MNGLYTLAKHLQGQHDQQSHAGKSAGRSLAARKTERVWNGKRQPKAAKKLSKNKVGELGERLAMDVLSNYFGKKFETLNEGINNSPIDIGNGNIAVEVKTGLASNSRSAQQWRATIGEPGIREKELLKHMTRDEKRAHNQYKQQRILERKESMLQELSQLSGKPVKGYTVGIILSSDGTKGDVYLFKGFHARLGWGKNATDESYLGSYHIN